MLCFRISLCVSDKENTWSDSINTDRDTALNEIRCPNWAQFLGFLTRKGLTDRWSCVRIIPSDPPLWNFIFKFCVETGTQVDDLDLRKICNNIHFCYLVCVEGSMSLSGYILFQIRRHFIRRLVSSSRRLGNSFLIFLITCIFISVYVQSNVWSNSSHIFHFRVCKTRLEYFFSVYSGFWLIGSHRDWNILAQLCEVPREELKKGFFFKICPK